MTIIKYASLLLQGFVYPVCGKTASLLQETFPDECILHKCDDFPLQVFKSPHHDAGVNVWDVLRLAKYLQQKDGGTLRDAVRHVVGMKSDNAKDLLLLAKKPKEQLLAENFVLLCCSKRDVAILRKALPEECFHWRVDHLGRGTFRHTLYFRSPHPPLHPTEVLPLARMLCQRRSGLVNAIRKICAMDDAELTALRVVAAMASKETGYG